MLPCRHSHPSEGEGGTAQGGIDRYELQQDRPAPAQCTGEQGQAKTSVQIQLHILGLPSTTYGTQVEPEIAGILQIRDEKADLGIHGLLMSTYSLELSKGTDRAAAPTAKNESGSPVRYACKKKTKGNG